MHDLIAQITANEWTLTGIGAAIITSMAAVIKMFWSKQEAEQKELKEEVKTLRVDVEECRDDREKLRIELAATNARIDKIEKQV